MQTAIFLFNVISGNGFFLFPPMESLTQYNVILVHGAADSLSGMDCFAADLKNAYEYYNDTTGTLGKIEGYLKISWDPEFGDLDYKDTSRSTATGMIKELNLCLNLNVITREGRV